MSVSTGAMRVRHAYLIAVVLAVVTVVSTALQIMIVPLLGTVGEALHEAPSAVNWSLIGAQIVGAASTPVLGRLGDQFGHRRLLVAAFVIMAVGSVLAAVAGSLAVLIAGRALQGVGAGTTALAIGLVRQTLPAEIHHRAIAIVTSGSGVGVGFGFILGGLLDSWRGAFWISLGACALSVLATLAVVPNPRGERASARGGVDWQGAVLLTAMLVALLLPLSQGSHWGWSSPSVVALFAAALILLAAFVAYELRRADPLVDLRLLARPPVALPNVTALLFGICLAAGFLLWVGYAETPPQLGYGFGASVLEAGTFLLPNALAVLIVAPAAGSLAKRFSPGPLLVGGMALGVVTFALLANHHDEKWQLYVGSAAWGTAVALGLVSLFLYVAQAVPARAAGSAAGITTLAQAVGNAIGSAVFTAVLTAQYIPHTPVPAASGYTHAFVVAAVFACIALVGAIATVAVDRARAAKPATVAPSAFAEAGAPR